MPDGGARLGRMAIPAREIGLITLRRGRVISDSLSSSYCEALNSPSSFSDGSGSGASDEFSVPCVLVGVAGWGDSIWRRKDMSVSGSTDTIARSVRFRVLRRLSALLVSLAFSPSSSRDLLELELRWDDDTDGLLARWLRTSRLSSTSFLPFWRRS